MKTPEEIKKGLHCCDEQMSCDECPYHGENDCSYLIIKEGLSYINQLEAERDAAVADLHYAVNHPLSAGTCFACAHSDDCYSGGDCDAVENDRWEWRGVQKEE